MQDLHAAYIKNAKDLLVLRMNKVVKSQALISRIWL